MLFFPWVITSPHQSHTLTPAGRAKAAKKRAAMDDDAIGEQWKD